MSTTSLPDGHLAGRGHDPFRHGARASNGDGGTSGVIDDGDDGIRASSVTNLTIVGNSGTGLAPAITGNYDNNLALTNDAATLTDFAAVDAVQNDGNAVMNITMESAVITEPGTTIDYAYGLRFVIGLNKAAIRDLCR